MNYLTENKDCLEPKYKQKVRDKLKVEKSTLPPGLEDFQCNNTFRIQEIQDSTLNKLRKLAMCCSNFCKHRDQHFRPILMNKFPLVKTKTIIKHLCS